jgi:hypothetical protein
MGTVMPVRPFLTDTNAFDQPAIEALSDALERACTALHINGHLRAREAVAARIIDLAQDGIIDADALSERVIAETKAMRSL